MVQIHGEAQQRQRRRMPGSRGMLFVLLFGLWLSRSAASGICPPVSEAIERNGLEPKMLIGIGAQKCGSDFIHAAMKTHPQIWPAKTKELHVFDKWSFQPDQKSYEKYLKKWGSLSDLNQTSRILMEFTPDYLHRPEAPCHIKHLFPNAKFIVTLRDPVYRVFSFMNMERNTCFQINGGQGACLNRTIHSKKPPGVPVPQNDLTCREWFTDPSTRFRNTEKVLQNNAQCLDAFSEDPWIDCPYYQLFALSRSLYAPQISRWLKIFDTSQFLFINAHELFLDPESHWKKICKFAGLDENWSPESPKKHANEILYIDDRMDELTSALERMLKKPYEDLYRLFDEYGIDFSPMPRESYAKNRSTVRVSDIHSKCTENIADASHRTLSRASTGANSSFIEGAFSGFEFGVILITFGALLPLMIVRLSKKLSQ